MGPSFDTPSANDIGFGDLSKTVGGSSVETALKRLTMVVVEEFSVVVAVLLVEVDREEEEVFVCLEDEDEEMVACIEEDT